MHHEDSHVANCLGRRRNLHNVAQHCVDGLVHVLDFLKLVTQAKAFHLGLQVGVLTAWNLVLVDFRRRRLQIGLEILVHRTHIRPVIGNNLQTIQVNARITLAALQRCNNGVQRRLRSQTRHAANGCVDDINASLRRHQARCHTIAAGIMRMQVDRQGNFVLQSTNQAISRIRLQQTRHILDANDVRAALLQLARHANVVIQVVLLAAGIQNVARVANGCFGNFALVEHFVQCNFHAGNPVQ